MKLYLLLIYGNATSFLSYIMRNIYHISILRLICLCTWVVLITKKKNYVIFSWKTFVIFILKIIIGYFSQRKRIILIIVIVFSSAQGGEITVIDWLRLHGIYQVSDSMSKNTDMTTDCICIPIYINTFWSLIIWSTNI